LRPAQSLEPREVASLRGRGKLNRYEAAVHHARHFDGMGPEALAAAIYPTWADGSASAYIAHAFSRTPLEAVEAAQRVLERPGFAPIAMNSTGRVRRTNARVARLTAIQVLAAAGTAEAQALLRALVARKDADAAVAAHARHALGARAPEAARRE